MRCVKLPASEVKNELADQVQFRRDGGYSLALLDKPMRFCYTLPAPLRKQELVESR